MTTPNKDRAEEYYYANYDDFSGTHKHDVIDAFNDGYQAACANKNAIIEKLTAPPSEGEIDSIVTKLTDGDGDYYCRYIAKAAITKWLEMRTS